MSSTTKGAVMGEAVNNTGTNTLQTGRKTNQKRGVLARCQHWSCWGLVGIGTAGLVLAALRPELQTGYSLLIFFGFITGYAFSVVAHELGHLLASVLLGLPLRQVVFGSGETLWQRRVRGIQWVLKAIPNSGHVQPRGLELHRWKHFLLVVAGPLTNGLLLWGAVTLLTGGPEWWVDLKLADKLAPTLFIVACVNAWAVALTLWPKEHLIDGVFVPSDGLQLWRIPFLSAEKLKAQQSMAQLSLAMELAHEMAQKDIEQNPTLGMHEKEVKLASLYWKYFLAKAQALDVATAFRLALEQAGASADTRAQMMDHFATWVLFAGAWEHLEEADRYSEELLRVQPDVWTTKGTRGSILIAKGELEAGRKLLLEVIDKDPSMFDQAISACFLAWGALKQNQIDEARQWLVRARASDPDCVPLGRVEGMAAQQSVLKP